MASNYSPNKGLSEFDIFKIIIENDLSLHDTLNGVFSALGVSGPDAEIEKQVKSLFIKLKKKKKDLAFKRNGYQGILEQSSSCHILIMS